MRALVALVLAMFLRPPAEVAVVANDYAFVQLPRSIAPGPTLFSFENHGKVRHELSIVLLQPGVNAEDVMAGKVGAIASRKVSESVLGILIARPGDPAGGRLYAELKAGQHYLVVCTLRDTPESKPHTEMGMFGSFTVE